MGLSAEVAVRISGLLEIQRDPIIKRWAALMQQTLRGRLTEAELSRDVAELYDTLLESLRSGEPVQEPIRGRKRCRSSTSLRRRWSRVTGRGA